MPSSLIIGALVVAWLVVLVPMVARKRQEVARTADSALAARVVRSGAVHRRTEESHAMAEAETDDEFVAAEEGAGSEEDDGRSRYYEVDDQYTDDQYTDDQYTEELPLPDDGYYGRTHAYQEGSARPYRPGRGGFDPEAAELTKRVRYAFRRRVVLGMLITTTLTALLAAMALPALWWAHLVIDLSLAGYLVYLRRQVRIEEEIRQRRLARMRGARREHVVAHDAGVVPPPEAYQEEEDVHPPARRRNVPPPKPLPGAVVVDVDDGDPEFDELAKPGVLSYRRASGE